MAAETDPDHHLEQDDEPQLALELTAISASPIAVAPAANSIPAINKKPPPGTWTPLETSHLIEAYAEKWYALKRGQLRTQHWEEVAKTLAVRCAGLVDCCKTSVQCRHKMEKLRRKYRAERQIRLRRGHGFSSTEPWPYFERMDLMERGPSSSSVAMAAGYAGSSSAAAVAAPTATGGGVAFVHGRRSAVPFLQNPQSNKRFRVSRDKEPQQDHENESLEEDAYDSDLPPPDRHHHNHHHHNRYAHPHPLQQNDTFVNRKHSRSSDYDAHKAYKVDDHRRSPKIAPSWSLRSHKPLAATSPVSELVSVIRWLGEGLLRIEQLKLQMQRENERLRADMEARHTEMLLNSQKEIAELFSRALSSSKKSKKMQS